MRDNIVAELRFAAKKWKEDNQRILFTGEIDVEQALSEAANAIEELSKPRWIPVTERLPKGEAERYLVAADFMAYGMRVSICYYADNLEYVDEFDFKGKKHGGFFGTDSEYGYYEKSGVQYWMPLPEPPKEEAE